MKIFDKLHNDGKIAVLSDQQQYAIEINKFLEMFSLKNLVKHDASDIEDIFFDATKLKIFSIEEKGNGHIGRATKNLVSILKTKEFEGFDRIAFNIAGGNNMKLEDANDIAQEIYDMTDPTKAYFVFGAHIGRNQADCVEITTIVGK